MSDPEPQRLAYRPEIDGLRALAVLLVIVYHGDFGFFAGGFVGVDVFFVISGFLITGILLADLDAGAFSPGTFYERRCRRILPPLAVMCAATLVAGWCVLMPLDYRAHGSSLVAAATFWANLYFYRHAGYFDTESFTKPLLHTWSLAVEEQFYVILPLLLWLLHARFRKWLPRVLAGVFVLSLAWSQALLSWQFWDKAVENAWYLLPSRFWEMLAGSLVALAVRGGTGVRPALRPVLCWLGLLLITGAAALYNHATPFPGLAALPPILGTALFIFASGGGGGGAPALPVRLFSHPWMTGIGKISYSLYLWHWPLLVMPRYYADAPLPAAAKAALLALAVVLAWLSWRFVENPVRRRAVLKTQRAVFAASLGVIFLLSALGTVVRWASGFPGRLPERARAFSVSARDQYGRPPWERYYHTETRNGAEHTFRVWDVNPGGPLAFLVLGNSHSEMWLPAVDMLAPEYGVSGLVLDHRWTKDLNLLSPSGASAEEAAQDEYALAILDMAQRKGVRHVLMSNRMAHLIGMPVKAEAPAAPNEGTKLLAARIRRTLEACAERGMTLWIAENVPEYDTAVPNTLMRNALRGGEAADLGYPVEHYRNRNSPLTALFPALEAEGLRILRMEPVFFRSGRSIPGDDAGGAYYYDGNHMTTYGARVHREALAPFFESVRDE